MPKAKITPKSVPQTNKPAHGPLTNEFRLWAWILLLWSLYRYFFHFPETVDEFLVKPLIFVVPILWYVRTIEKRRFDSLGINLKNLFPSLYMGIGLGLLFTVEGILANSLKNGTLSIQPLEVFKQYGFFLIVISLATAFSEEVLGRGFLFSRFYEKTKGNMIVSSLLSSGMFFCLHIPILLTSLHYQGMTLFLFFLTGFAISLANCFLFRQTKSLVAPILVHLFWNMAVALYL